MEEQWRDIKGYEGRYQISNFGRIRSLIKKRLIRQNENKDGYYCVFLYRDKARVCKPVHSLVYFAFSGDERNGLVVDHIDGDKRNNRFDNLQLLTNYENTVKGWSAKKKSGFPVGVFSAKNGGYIAQLYAKRKRIYLGHYLTIDEAADAYRKAREAYTANGEVKTHRQRSTFDADGYKVCPCCGERKHKSEYYLYKGRTTTGKCKKCSIEYNNHRHK